MAENQENFRIVVEYATDVITRHASDGRYLYVSPAGKELFGQDPADLIGKMSTDEIHPDDVERFKNEYFEQIGAEDKSVIEYRRRRKDGTYIWVENVAHAIRHPETGEVEEVICVIRDVTRRREAEKRWKQQHHFFEQMFLQSSVSTQILDKDGWCERINPKLSELFGVKPEHIEGNRYNIFQDEGIRQGGVLPHLEKAFREGKTAEWEVFFDIGLASESTNVEVKEKTRRWFHNRAFPVFDESGKVTHVIIQHTDISAWKQMEEELRINLEKYRVLFKTFPVGVTVSNEKGEIVESNPESERLLGLSPEEQRRRQIDGREWKIIRSDGSPMPAEEYASVRALKENRLVEDVEMGIVKEPGDITWISVSATPIPLEGFGVVITYFDISKRKDMDRIFLEKMQELERFNKVMIGRELKMIELKKEIRELRDEVKKIKDERRGTEEVTNKAKQDETDPDHIC